ncbi:hypothetical protein [Helicobacter kayseriensis]|uniref:hypothetical protein n=1 Tax=Helicobacter kayseriensis TaxID=2905877 RepID=UPI001E5EB267|nr:hypothetical protein [Helicobacter kayseriensis]MCE3047807.1 hypothetical protein [Helicobacter kayseriensis]MCE3049170.1 hypothetical protein [Helicobacter kayseriensis]
MQRKNEGTLITGLWENRKNEKIFYIGRISGNLNAILVENKNKRNENDPTHLLYFFNGKKDEILDFVGERYE